MSLIARALKKAAESRQVPAPAEPKPESIVYLAEKQQPWPKTAILVLATLATATISASIWAIMATVQNSQSSRTQVISLERNIKAEEKKINALTVEMRYGQKSADARIHNLKSYLNQEADDLNDRITGLISRETGHYGNLKQAVLDDRQQLVALGQYTKSVDRYTKSLDKKIEDLTTVPDAQINGTVNRVSGN